jgi:hypothetical protein
VSQGLSRRLLPKRVCVERSSSIHARGRRSLHAQGRPLLSSRTWQTRCRSRNQPVVKASIQGGGSSAGRLFYLEFPLLRGKRRLWGNTPCINLCRPFGAAFTIYPQWREAIERVIAAQMARDATEPGTPQRETADKEVSSSPRRLSLPRGANPPDGRSTLAPNLTRGPVCFRSICATALCVPYTVQAPAKNQESLTISSLRRSDRGLSVEHNA